MNPLMKKFYILCILSLPLLSINNVLGQDSSIDQTVNIETFEQFKEYFHKEYDGEDEEELARQNFEKSKKWISENQHKLEFDVGITFMADQDIVNDIENVPLSLPTNFPEDDHQLNESNSKVPILEHFDWREHIWMSPVIDQGKCGSCWAFTSAVMIETHLALHHNETLILSKQELIDCAKEVAWTNAGCDGGHVFDGFEYARKRGIHLEQAYPLINNANGTLKYNCTKDVPGPKFHIKDYYALNFGSADQEIQKTMLKYGPVSVSVIAGFPEFRHYKSGIMKNLRPNPPAGELDHVVVLVGWGRDPIENVSYWIIRNSWGPTWGEQGYGRIQRGINSCGINSHTLYLECEPQSLHKPCRKSDI